MDTNRVEIGAGYPGGQLARAFRTAQTHEDAATRQRAEERLRAWQKVLDGMSAGTLTVGSRTPVAGLPAWVTPQVLRGGFATGEAAAGGPLLPHEEATATRIGLRHPNRLGLFFHYVSDAGLAELEALLDSGQYDVTVPEEAALPTVAWLLRSGDRVGALALLDELRPFAQLLRFTPQPSDAPMPDGVMVHRETVADVRAALGARRPNTRVATMNEALTVWNPFADQLLDHWLETVSSEGTVGAATPDDWTARGRELLARYHRLKGTHTLCGKHRNPKENAAILRAALQTAVSGRRMAPRERGLLQHAVDSMVARRGTPGSPEHTRLRERQAADAALVSPYELAKLLLGRLASVPVDTGLPETDWVVAPVSEAEAEGMRPGVRIGTEIPDALRQVVERALSAPVATLVARGVVPSAEVLAGLAPQLVGATAALAYHDEALRTLVAATHRAFANRRSLLLLNLESQVRIDELPWVAAVRPYRRPARDTAGLAQAALVEMATLTLRAFPATILPNPMIQELGTLARQSGLDLPLTEELAADIFMGMFADKFRRAAVLAADLLEGSLYARYFDIDYAAVRALPAPQPPSPRKVNRRRPNPDASPTFGSLCTQRANRPKDGSWVARNGMVIEQAQILTTHNLAALVHPVGASPAEGWDSLARGAFAGTCRLVAQVHNNPRPLGTIKDAAYAWRQTVFFMSLCGLADQISVMAAIQDTVKRQPDHVTRRLDPVVAGLRHVLVGGTLDTAAPTARRFTAWAADGHWMRRV